MDLCLLRYWVTEMEGEPLQEQLSQETRLRDLLRIDELRQAERPDVILTWIVNWMSTVKKQLRFFLKTLVKKDS